ncbi:TonB-dependent receptor [Sphingomonadaceae bacterium jetA1]|jgi:TonB-dependent receptor|uniref:TonB-dependent receptor n=1 Tax=Facivitalis istanbulensis TaxID=3075838 RepID=UPI003480B165
MIGRYAVALLATSVFCAPAIHAKSSYSDNDRNFSIPAQPLARALTSFGQQAGRQIFFPADSIRGLQSPRVQGRMSARAALALLLNGSGLTVRRDDGRTIVLGLAGPAPVVQSDPPAGGPHYEAAHDIVVTGSAPLEEEKALAWKRQQVGTNAVMSGETIARRPGGNIVDILAVLPGVAAYADMGLGQAATGEAEFISIRGLDSSFNEYSINGMRVPQADPYTRALSLKMIAPYGLRSATVAKTPTAADYGSSIGGTVDIATPTGFQFGDNYLRVTGGGNFAGRANHLGFPAFGGVGQIEVGKLFGTAQKVGLYATGYYEERRSAAEATEALRYIPATPTSARDDLVAMGIKYDMYNSVIKRYGGNASIDFHGDDGVTAFVRGSYGRYEVSSIDVQHSVTSALLQLVGAAPFYNNGQYNPLGTLAGSYFQARDQRSTLATVQAGADMAFTDRVTLSARASYGYADQRRPNYVEGSLYSGLGLALDSNGQPIAGVRIDTSNPAAVRLDFADAAQRQAVLSPQSVRVWKFQGRDVSSDDRMYGMRADLGWRGDGVVRKLTTGIDLNVSDRTQYDRGLLGNDGDNFVIADAAGGRPNLFNGQGPTAAALPGRTISFMGGNYPDFRFYDRSYFEKAILPYAYSDQFTPNGTPNPGAYTQNDYNRNTVFGTETVLGGYVQAELQLGKLQAVGGVRYESTDFAASHWLRAQNSGHFVRDGNRYGEWLPSLNLTYRPTDQLILRAAARRSFARPAFALIAGPETYGYNDLTGALQSVSRANPDLKPVTATSFDANIEWYPDRSAVIEAGGFYKKLSNFIFTASATGSGPGGITAADVVNGITYTMPMNGRDADVYGLELHGRKQFWELGPVLGGFGVEGSLTLQDSKADPGVTGRGKTELPRAAKLIYNAELFYERPHLSARLAWQYVGRQLLSLNDQLDNYLQPIRQLNVNATYTLGRWSLSGQVQNLLNNYSFYKTMGTSTRYLGTQDGGGNGSYVETGRFYKTTLSYRF